VRAFLKIPSRSVSRPGTSWLTLLLLLVVLAPSVCLVWFMVQAVRNERLAVRQKLVDAYRGQLVVTQQKIESLLREKANQLDAEAETLAPAALFAREIRANVADALICFDANGRVVYPSLFQPTKKGPPEKAWLEAERLESTNAAAATTAFAGLAAQTTNPAMAARALQAQARSLIHATNTEAALSVLLGPLNKTEYRQATDFEGRLLVPNAQLMALELLSATDSNRASAVRAQLKRQLLDYDNPALSAAQRRFLMRQFQRFDSDPSVQDMLAAEDLAAAFIESVQTDRKKSSATNQPGLLQTPSPGVWQFASPKGRVILLHKNTENLLARIAGSTGLKDLPPDVTVALMAPGHEAQGAFVLLPAGPSLPDWRYALSLKDQKLFDAAADQRVAAYVWIGVLVVLAVIVLALLILRLMRRQMNLTRLRNDLVANVTHELKTPLAGMRLLVDTLLNSEKLDEPTAREYLALIAKENLRLSRLIDNFLAFSRMERNKYALDFKEVPAQAVIEGAVSAAGERFNAPGCHLSVRTTADLPQILADPDAMVTAVVNLLDNAWKYSGDEKQISLTASAENGSVMFSVQDNGLGLSPRDTKRIFKRFYQVDQRLSRTGGGCGLGLSIVKFIVIAHGGKIRLESELGKGSKFTMTLPSAPSLAKSEGRNSKLESNPKSEALKAQTH
jgi:signal transduction histidine kinase